MLVVAGIAVDFLIGIFTDLLGAQQRNDVINFAGFVSIVLYAILVVAILSALRWDRRRFRRSCWW